MKKTYLITYDIPKGSDYEELYEYIKSFGTWAHIAESLWAVKSDQTAVDIRNEIQVLVSDDSTIFVIKSGIEAAWSNVICRNQWLKDSL